MVPVDILALSKKRMPASGAEYALLQRKYKYENMLKRLSSHRTAAREREKYYMASQRNGLEEQRGNLRNGLERLSPSVKAYYLDNIAQLTARIDASRKSFPFYRGDYDN